MHNDIPLKSTPTPLSGQMHLVNIVHQSRHTGLLTQINHDKHSGQPCRCLFPYNFRGNYGVVQTAFTLHVLRLPETAASISGKATPRQHTVY